MIYLFSSSSVDLFIKHGKLYERFNRTTFVYDISTSLPTLVNYGRNERIVTNNPSKRKILSNRDNSLSLEDMTVGYILYNLILLI